jgi:nicotinamide-nucleotide amidase
MAMRRGEETLDLAVKLGELARRQGIRIATAESCTGGLLAGAITSVPGSSVWYERGFVTYSNEAKTEDIEVPESTLARFGAVSEQTVRAMAEGALAASRAQWAVAVTGIAGPDGGSPEKPVGTVWFAWARQGDTQAALHRLAGDRAAVRQASVGIALQGLIDRMA